MRSPSISFIFKNSRQQFKNNNGKAVEIGTGIICFLASSFSPFFVWSVEITAYSSDGTISAVHILESNPHPNLICMQFLAIS
jgi:hypothetical protein